MARRSDIDWEGVERAFRLGVLTVRQIAVEYSIAVSSITRQAKKGNWTRDLSREVQARTKAKLIEEEVKKSSRAIAHTEKRAQEIGTACAQAVESDVEAAANINVAVVMRHRAELGELRQLANEMVAELKAVTGAPVEIANLLAALSEKEEPRLNDLAKVLSLPSRISSAERLSNTYSKLISLEREAFGIDSRKTAGQTLDEFLDGIAAEAS